MQILLLYPPAGDVRAPQLAMPSLAAFLRQSGHTVTLRDLNLEAVLALLCPERLSAAITTLRDTSPLPARTAHLLKLVPALLEQLAKAPATLRTPESFFDPHQFNTAREALNLAAELHAAALPRAVNWKIIPLDYSISGADPARLQDLLDVTAQDDGNAFATLWRDSLLPELAIERPDVIGITLTNRQQWWPGLYLARLLHAAGHYVVLGGALVSKFVDRLKFRPLFFQTFCSAVIAYEGEHALLGLLDARAGKRTMASVPNLLYWDKAKGVCMGSTHVEDVACLPSPDFSGLPLADYLIPFPVLPILTGKGCYFNRCKFCDIPHINHISRKAYRIRPVKQVLADMLQLEAEQGCQHFLITDEALAPKLLGELADALQAAGKTYAYTGYARFEPGFTAELCQRLAAAGMKKLYFGLESASQTTIDHMDKGVQMAHVLPVLSHCQAAGIHFHIFSIIGFPEESETEARKTFQFFLDHTDTINAPGNSFDIHPFGLELHTQYFQEHADNGIGFDPRVLQRDFVVGLDATEWENRRGLRPERIGQLINTEFYPALRAAYPDWHNTPLHLWPGFEEYAVLYSDWYAQRSFLAITSLAGVAEGQRFTLRWHPLHYLEQQGEQTLLGLPHTLLPLPSVLIPMLATPGYWNISSLTAAFFGDALAEDATAREQMKSMIHALCGHGAIQISLCPPPQED